MSHKAQSSLSATWMAWHFPCQSFTSGGLHRLSPTSVVLKVGAACVGQFLLWPSAKRGAILLSSSTLASSAFGQVYFGQGLKECCGSKGVAVQREGRRKKRQKQKKKEDSQTGRQAGREGGRQHKEKHQQGEEWAVRGRSAPGGGRSRGGWFEGGGFVDGSVWERGGPVKNVWGGAAWSGQAWAVGAPIFDYFSSLPP